MLLPKIITADQLNNQNNVFKCLSTSIELIDYSYN